MDMECAMCYQICSDLVDVSIGFVEWPPLHPPLFHSVCYKGRLTVQGDIFRKEGDVNTVDSNKKHLKKGVYNTKAPPSVLPLE